MMWDRLIEELMSVWAHLLWNTNREAEKEDEENRDAEEEESG